MSFWGALTGSDQASADRAAAADTYKKQQDAISGITSYGDQVLGNYRDLAKGYQPYVNTGNTATLSLDNLLRDPSSFTSTPYYQSGLQQGNDAITNSAVGRGSLFSGKTGKDLQKYGEDYFNNKYTNYLGTLSGVSGMGLNALGGQNSTVGQGLQDQYGTRQSAYQGNMNSASTIGQGDIAAANAEGQGALNLANLGLNVGKLALGGIGGMGGLGFGGGGGGTAGVMNYGGQSWPAFG